MHKRPQGAPGCLGQDPRSTGAHHYITGKSTGQGEDGFKPLNVPLPTLLFPRDRSPVPTVWHPAGDTATNTSTLLLPGPSSTRMKPYE